MFSFLKTRFEKIESLLGDAMAGDRYRVRAEIRHLKGLYAGPASRDHIRKRLFFLEKLLLSSGLKRVRRQSDSPPPVYNESLPIFAKKDEIVDAIRRHRVLIVSGETGSGKTTQIPKFCIEAGRGIEGMIGCTQPRRIAAVSVCRRIAEELGEEPGRSVGYKMRFTDRTGERTYIKIMTDGILLAEAQADPALTAYDTLIVDEAHERSLNIDFVLGILKTLLEKREDLRVIITSATIDTEKFSSAFDRAPVIEVSGRLYPVEVRYSGMLSESGDAEDQTHIDKAVEAFDGIQNKRAAGDVLIFMPTEQDILETVELIEGRKYAATTVLALYARLPAQQQSRVFSRVPGRKVIVATNVAETSITIPGIRYVIDTGLARVSMYSPRTRTTSLPVVPISRSSADQRKGRCGRVQNGVCIRLYPEEDYLSRPLFTPPEILRANLAEVILRMIALGLGDFSDFPFIDRPSPKSVQDGFDLLYELGAITAPAGREGPKRKKAVRLTETGKLMARLPVDPRLSRMLIEAKEQGCLPEVTILTAALSVQDPRERPSEKNEEADRIHASFIDPMSDFLTLLNIWTAYHRFRESEKATGKMKKYCKEHFLSYRRIREWQDVHSQLCGILEDCRMNAQGSGGRPEPSADESKPMPASRYAAIHRSILSGFLSNIAVKKEKNIFHATKGREVMIFPGSGLFDRAGSWIVAAEVVETTRPFARTVAAIDSGWLEDLGRHQCTYRYFDARWDKDREEVAAFEEVRLYGLTIVGKRTVSYGKINPSAACAIFIREALVAGHIQTSFAFLAYNQRLIDGIRDMENRLRRKDLLVGEQERAGFYAKRLTNVYDVKTLRAAIRKQGGDAFLRMTPEDLLARAPDEEDLSLFPAEIRLGDRPFPCAYRYEPGHRDDGVTVTIPYRAASSVPLETLDWIVPGLLKEKITNFLKGLPKSYRKKLLPLSPTAEILAREMPKGKELLHVALSRFIKTRFGVEIPVSAWSEKSLPEHLRMRISLTGPGGEEVLAGRDRIAILEKIGDDSGLLDTEPLAAAKRAWEKDGITRWDFGDLPETVELPCAGGAEWTAYPALEITSRGTFGRNTVAIRLFTNQNKAEESHRAAVAALFANHLAEDLKFLKKQMTLPSELRSLAEYFGGASRFEKSLISGVVAELFDKAVRTEKDFFAHAADAAQKLFAHGREKLTCGAALLKAYTDCRTMIRRFEEENSGNTGLLDFLDRIRGELSRLVPESFAERYPPEKMRRIERYVQAIAVRARRGTVDLEKDNTRDAAIRPYIVKLEGFQKDLGPADSKEKRQAVKELFWLIEEFKVSVFAQELKTAVPVSKKRLDEKVKQIEALTHAGVSGRAFFRSDGHEGPSASASRS